MKPNDMEISVYLPRSRTAWIFYVIFLVCLFTAEKSPALYLVGFISFAGYLGLFYYATHKAKTDSRYRYHSKLVVDDTYISRGWLTKFKISDVSEITYSNNRLEIRTTGYPVTYNVCEGQDEKVNELISNVVHATKKPGQGAFSVTYKGKTLDLRLDSDNYDAERLTKSIKNIADQVVIDEILLKYLDHSSVSFPGSAVETVCEQINNRSFEADGSTSHYGARLAQQPDGSES